MRISLALVLSIVLAVGLVAFGFTYYQISVEKMKLHAEHEARIVQVCKEIITFDSLKQREQEKVKLLQWIGDVKRRFNLAGIALFYDNERIISDIDSAYSVQLSKDNITQAIIADSSIGFYENIEGKYIHQFMLPLKSEKISEDAIILISDATYIQNIIGSIWLRNFIRWFVQALLVSLITVLIIRWGIFSPINKIVNWVRAARLGNVEQLEEQSPARFLTSLHNEIVHIAKAMHEANAKAEEEAILRSKSEAIWTSERLRIEIGRLLQNKKLTVVSNREPYMHIREGKNIKCIVPASGLITAMEPILKACGGLWIASGTGDADREVVDKHDKVQVPPENPKYSLRRLWLSREEETHFYYGFSNEGLWPLCHIAHTRPIFRKEDWNHYKKVNEDFARAVIEETKDEEQPFILIQDYHFALLPQLIKKEKPNAKIAIFWHIPWPNPESFGICPWQKDILSGMLGADLIGFHTQYHCNHFMETVNNALESRVLWENFSVKIAGQTTFIKPFPISIDFTLKDLDRDIPKSGISQLLNEHGISAEYMGIGVDRIDYTKGLLEKFLAIERFLEKYPSYIEKFTFVQIGAPSRTSLKTYADIMLEIENSAKRINTKFKSKNWKPILLLTKHHSHEEIAPYYASADFCMVSSLHDGMNLVAKEYIAARSQNDGNLILSCFAGASQELQGAIVINPYDTEKSADAIKLALEMTTEEQHQRMHLLRQAVVANNIYFWAASLLRTMAAIRN